VQFSIFWNFNGCTGNVSISTQNGSTDTNEHVPGVVLLRQPHMRVEGVALGWSPDEGRGGETFPVGGPVEALLRLVEAERGGPHAHPVRVVRVVVVLQLGAVHPLHGAARVLDGKCVRLLLEAQTN
jgi:hypothetical protein